MGLKKSWKYGWVWDDDETTTPHMTWASTRTVGEPVEFEALKWDKNQPIIVNSPMWEYKPAILQGWECPKCGRVNSPTTATCPCYLVK
jgi:hypothetical protein